MFITDNNPTLGKNTIHKVVILFYLYAAISFLFATILLFLSTSEFTHHYFNPKILAITHTMALGWGTMIILGASHQLVPVITEGRLYSNTLAYFSFAFAAVGIPLLVYGFYFFNMRWPTQWGAIFINVAIVTYIINLAISMAKSKKENVHAVFLLTATLWLLLTTLFGFALVCNFTGKVLLNDSVHYLPLHAHMGMIGWFLLLAIGVASRVIPMLLISKYSKPWLLWFIYILINVGLMIFIVLFMYFPKTSFYFIPATLILIAIFLFGYYCYCSFRQRIRKKVDELIQFSLGSVIMMIIPPVLIAIIIVQIMLNSVNTRLISMYGFVIFFGWITSLIIGMTFKTLPFIVWNKVYHLQAGLSKTPNPKDLYSTQLFNAMRLVYLAGLVLFIIGIYSANILVLRVGAIFLLLTALLYNWNVLKVLFHKSKEL